MYFLKTNQYFYNIKKDMAMELGKTIFFSRHISQKLFECAEYDLFFLPYCGSRLDFVITCYMYVF